MLKIFQYFTGNDRRQHAAAARWIRTAKSRRQSRKRYTSTKVPQDGDRGWHHPGYRGHWYCKELHTYRRQARRCSGSRRRRQREVRPRAILHPLHPLSHPSVKGLHHKPTSGTPRDYVQSCSDKQLREVQTPQARPGCERCALRVVISHLHTRTDCLWFIHWDTAPGATPSVFAMSFCK